MTVVMSYVAGVESKSKTRIIVNHNEHLALDEYHELVKYFKIQNQYCKSMCCWYIDSNQHGHHMDAGELFYSLIYNQQAL